jgi:4-hydroxy-3-methylbut-2-en-1-yl diphosphate synthase IspG/GcpE
MAERLIQMEKTAPMVADIHFLVEGKETVMVVADKR